MELSHVNAEGRKASSISLSNRIFLIESGKTQETANLSQEIKTKKKKKIWEYQKYSLIKQSNM
jgi:hypothetical protein